MNPFARQLDLASGAVSQLGRVMVLLGFVLWFGWVAGTLAHAQESGPAPDGGLHGVQISEVMAANLETRLDDDGDPSDWFELSNSSAGPVDLGGCYLSDDLAVPQKWQVPPGVTLAAQGHLLIWASGKGRVTEAQGQRSPSIHTNFKLNRDADHVLLSDRDGVLIDQLSWQERQFVDRSLGRVAGEVVPCYFLFPTPSKPNSTHFSATPIPRHLDVMPPSQRFTGALTVQMRAPLPFSAVVYRYRLGGEAPTYKDVPFGRDAAGRRVRVSGGKILSVTESTVVRVAAFVGSVRVSGVTTRTYLEESAVAGLSLPLTTVVVAPTRLDYLYENYQAHGREYEVPATLELWGKGFAVARQAACGFRFQGGGGRSDKRDVKICYRVRFDREYGASNLRAPLFSEQPECFDKLIFRAANLDRFGVGTLLRDQLMRDLHAAMGALTVRGTYRGLCVNGEYRGIYNIIERPDSAFFRSHRGDVSKQWHIVKDNRVVEGDGVPWRELLRIARGQDMTPAEQAQQLRQQLDVARFIDYIILNTWAGNWDWPNHNYVAYRPASSDLAAGEVAPRGTPADDRTAGDRSDDTAAPSDAGSKEAASKAAVWRFLSWDAESGMKLQRVDIDLFGALFQKTTPEQIVPRGSVDTEIGQIFGAVMKHAEFRALFLPRMRTLFSGPLSEEHVIAALDARAAQLRPDIGREGQWMQARGKFGSLRSWERKLDRVRDFVRERRRLFEKQVWQRPEFDAPRIFDVDRSQVSPGEQLVISGRDLKEDMAIRFGSTRVLECDQRSSTGLRVRVPNSLEPGVHKVALHDGDQRLWQLHFDIEVVAAAPK